MKLKDPASIEASQASFHQLQLHMHLYLHLKHLNLYHNSLPQHLHLLHLHLYLLNLHHHHQFRTYYDLHHYFSLQGGEEGILIVKNYPIVNKSGLGVYLSVFFQFYSAAIYLILPYHFYAMLNSGGV